MAVDIQAMADRLDAIEAQLRGDPGVDPIDLDAIPLAQLQTSLENSWQPLGDALEPKSVTAKEIGVLPGIKAYFDEANSHLLNPAGAWITVGWAGATVEYDTDKMMNLVGGYNGIVVRTPGRYIVTFDNVWANDNPAGNSHRYSGIWVQYASPAAVRNIGMASNVEVGPSGTRQSVTAHGYFSTGDLIYAAVFYDAGANQHLGAGGGERAPSIAATWVST